MIVVNLAMETAFNKSGEVKSRFVNAFLFSIIFRFYILSSSFSLLTAFLCVYLIISFILLFHVLQLVLFIFL